MNKALWIISWIIGLGSLAYHRVPLLIASIVIELALIGSWLLGGMHGFIFFILIILATTIAIILNNPNLRRRYCTLPIMQFFKNSLPVISKTEQIALQAGTVGWDGELFSGKPNWKKFLQTPAPFLTQTELDFINGPVEILCNMISDWEINYQLKDLPQEIWNYIKKEKFFGIVIPKSYGGLGFSALAHSEIVAKIASKSTTVATTVSVPNSLGPAELLLHYGTLEQKEYYLPKLAKGEEIPCFALTGPDAGSDATSIPDKGIICKKLFNKQETLGILLNFNKRYITLAPIATVIGLAFKLYDPEKLLGDQEKLGITCALIRANTPGVNIGKRHIPLTACFQNGPITGSNVFIPLDWIIGGPSMIGQGWKMLVECLSCGRAISLPAISSGKARIAYAASSAYARIRYQFKQPIGFFEGIQEPLVKIASTVYLSEAARKITASYVDQGEKPAILGAIVKSQITERSRQAAIYAMDIHGGKTIMLGPKNYLAEAYINAPIGVTVEGANILTRSLIIFGQGAIRCHPFISKEMAALQEPDQQQALLKFDTTIMSHIGYSLSNAVRSIFFYITRAKLLFFSSNKQLDRYVHWITWGSSCFAFLSDSCLLILGGKLKFKERLSGRLGDLLSYLYLASTILKRFHDEGSNKEDLLLIDWTIKDLMSKFWITVDEILQNLPKKWFSLFLRCILMPLGKPIDQPDDGLGKKLALSLLEPNTTRARLLNGSYLKNNENNPVGQMELVFAKTVAVYEIEKRLQQAIKDKILIEDPFEGFEGLIKQGLNATIINHEEANLLQEVKIAQSEVIAVDEFMGDLH